MKTKFKIIVITPETFLRNELSILQKLFSAGLNSLHVRKPGATEEQLRTYLLQIPKQYHQKIVIHDYAVLAKEFILKGVHLTERSRVSEKTTRFLKRNKIKIISSSFHSIVEINKSRRKYEYIFLSPVFNSISKNNYHSAFHLDALNPFLKNSKNKIVALGGIKDTNIGMLKNYGFSGAATVGYLWQSKDPVSSYLNLVSKIQ